MLDAIIFFSFLLFLYLWNAYKDKKVTTEIGYLLANRSTGMFALVCTLVMTEFNPSTLVAFSQVGYVAGIWGLTLPSVFLFGLLFYTFTVAEKWKALNVSSVAELFTLRYHPLLGKMASLFLLLAMLGFTANYIKSLQILFAPIFSMNENLLSLLIATVVVLVTWRGGLFSIIRTDIYGFIGTLIFIVMLFFFTSQEISENISTTISIEEGQKVLPIPFVFSLIILTMFTYIAAPWYGQKIFSARDKKTAFYSVGIASVLVFILYSLPVLSVYNLKLAHISLERNDSGISTIVYKFFPIGLKGFAYLVLFLAGVTTLGGVWSAMTTMVIVDFLEQDISETQETFRGKSITVVLASLSYIISITFIDKLLDKLILANVPVASLSYGLLASFYWKKANIISVVTSATVGFAWGSFCYLYFGEGGMYTWYWAVYGIPLIFGVGILSSFLFPQKDEEKEKIEKFYERLKS